MHYGICPRAEIAVVVSCNINLLSSFLVMIILCSILGVDHLIFDGGVVEIPKKISSMCFWLKKNIMQNS